jgi:hypothetical protein
MATTISDHIDLLDIKDQQISFLEGWHTRVEVNSKRSSKHYDLALQAVSRRHYEEVRQLKRKLEKSQATVKAQNDTISQLQEENERW